MPEDPSQKLYSVHKTTIWFAAVSVLLTVSLLLIVFQDHHREWKQWQKKFVALERQKAAEEVKAASAKIDSKKLEELQRQLQAAKEKFEQGQSEFDRLKNERAQADLELVKAVTLYQNLKQQQDSYKFFLEEYREKGTASKASEYESKFQEVSTELNAAALEKEKKEGRVNEIDAGILSLQSEQKRLQKELDSVTRERDRYEKQVRKLTPSWVKSLLNAPMFDFVAPSFRIQQVVLEELTDDFYFAKAYKVDRCTTCHLAIDRKGFEDAPQPFRTHPNLDLFLNSDSPHPLEKVGCTVCHGGSGQSLSFTQAAHTPDHSEQAKAWQKNYGWHELEKWEAKMLPLKYIEASCTTCHAGVADVPKAPKLNEGRRLAQTYGCFGCHLVKGFENRWKVGPDLRNVRSKLDREWIVRWLQNPKTFRPSTQMPRVFHLENTSSAEDKRVSNAAIEGMAAYLSQHSNIIELETPPMEGDPEIGKRLIEEVGCLGCHSHEDAKVNHHGPELTSMGSKVSREWLYTWLKNPKHYAPETRMPSVRLTDEEAAHITRYLITDRNEPFDALELPRVSEQDLDQLAVDFLTRNVTHDEANAALAKMNVEEKFEFVGKKAILEQGCFGCHMIQGFEDAKRIGTELTQEGEKSVERFDFGFVDIEHTRHDWFAQKLKSPRIFDRGRIKGYHEKLRMPDFGFTDEQAEALTLFLLSLRDAEVPLSMKRNLNLNEAEIETGRLLLAKLNCAGCHSLDGTEGRVRPLFEDFGNAPPVLDGEGAKVQENWLYHFLKNPEAIRPWLTYRMPTFGFSDEEADALVKYFTHLAGEKISYVREQVKADPQLISEGGTLFKQFKCIQCHQPGETQTMAASFRAPDLVLAKNRLKPAWVVEWLRDPQTLQEGTMMPSFFPDGETPLQTVLGGDAQQQIKAIRDYLWTFTEDEAVKVKSGS
ncbi:MAG: hypothetical protein A3A73_03250 [Omnitrophica bacterium RIFCSPLOWO2_01_FULL_50_24]|nr:MAG: hypothetical protein A3A73_03250 [Omnitrophica bacterium RIFCSPLOWO2_01_FULL_50_24]